ncbi:CyP450 monooxygenase [Polyporus arcularius HHB13444]|uniref:CyP450 monooxygenase n=1 Tax=Polyporus arcularius HHB13444 TaxID=1314778 RepID=A0A5C3NU94_9APHY|nr:CyP450 monooxygenase [Polyporus arcularius HHB13444]
MEGTHRPASGLPIIGNVLDIPLENMELYLHGLSVKYGEIISLSTFGTPMIVLGTHEAAVELLEKRSSIYSDRNMTPTVKLAGFDWLIAMMCYGARCQRKFRAVFHQCMNPNMIVQYRPIQEAEIKKYLLRLVEDPVKFYEHGRHLIGAMIIRVAYGLEVIGENDKYIKIAEDAMDCFNIVFQPGRYLVQTFPSLRRIPSWFPGAGFKREFAAWFPVVRKIHEVPWEAAMAARRKGHVPPSIITTLMDRAKVREDEEAAQVAAANAYMAGADTTLSTLQTFFAALTSNPHIQKRAQDALETMVGPDHLPTMEDKPDLPYITAIAKECLRWRSVVPLAVPHLATQEDEYKGYRIPAGSVVIANTWAYSSDTRYYPDPETFQPERFLLELLGTDQPLYQLHQKVTNTV